MIVLDSFNFMEDVQSFDQHSDVFNPVICAFKFGLLFLIIIIFLFSSLKCFRKSLFVFFWDFHHYELIYLFILLTIIDQLARVNFNNLNIIQKLLNALYIFLFVWTDFDYLWLIFPRGLIQIQINKSHFISQTLKLINNSLFQNWIVNVFSLSFLNGTTELQIFWNFMLFTSSLYFLFYYFNELFFMSGKGGPIFVENLFWSKVFDKLLGINRAINSILNPIQSFFIPIIKFGFVPSHSFTHFVF